MSVTQLCQQPLVVRESGSGSRWCLERTLARAGKSTTDLRIVLELGSNEAIKEAVLRGVGLAVLSDQVVQKEVQSGLLYGLAVAGLPAERDIYAVWDRRRPLLLAVRCILRATHPPAGVLTMRPLPGTRPRCPLSSASMLASAK